MNRFKIYEFLNNQNWANDFERQWNIDYDSNAVDSCRLDTCATSDYLYAIEQDEFHLAQAYFQW